MKRSRDSLVLMEQLAMLLVFALAAAVCLRLFVGADRMARQLEDTDRAYALAQNAAETLRHTGGDFIRAGELLNAAADADSFMLDLAEDWTEARDTMRYTLGAARLDSTVPGLGRARVWVRDETDDTELARLDIAWQEVMGDGA